MFVIRLATGEYLTRVQLTSSYLEYERTPDRAAADRLNDFDSLLVMKRLRNLGEKNPEREELPAES
jgi:hypothetical protein